MLDGVKLSGGYSSFEDAEESEIWKGASGKV